MKDQQFPHEFNDDLPDFSGTIENNSPAFDLDADDAAQFGMETTLFDLAALDLEDTLNDIRLPEDMLRAEDSADDAKFDALHDIYTALPNDNAAPDAPADEHFDAEPETIPTIFPDKTPEDAPTGEPTVVPRPVRKRKGAARKILRVLAVLGKWVIALVLAAAILVGGLVGYLTVTEYTPAYAENAQRGTVAASETPSMLQSMRIVTFNTGYAGLGEDADFFMDGGAQVNPDSEATVLKNQNGVEKLLKQTDADYIFLQEVDTDSDRTFHRNQWLQYENALSYYESRFALNYSCDYVPYPFNERIGEVHSGIATFSRFDISSATRYRLPCPFSWPTRVANLKRCLLVTRIPLSREEEAPELVLVNFHLEAYDDGEGKAAQTEQLFALLKEEYSKGNYVIAGGDFNQTFVDALNAYPIKSTSEWTPGVLESAPFGWQYAYDATTPTCRLLNQPYAPTSSLTQYFVIDGFLVSPNVQINRVETLNEGFVYSDHNPVVLDFTLLSALNANALN